MTTPAQPITIIIDGQECPYPLDQAVDICAQNRLPVIILPVSDEWPVAHIDRLLKENTPGRADIRIPIPHALIETVNDACQRIIDLAGGQLERHDIQDIDEILRENLRGREYQVHLRILPDLADRTKFDLSKAIAGLLPEHTSAGLPPGQMDLVILLIRRLNRAMPAD